MVIVPRSYPVQLIIKGLWLLAITALLAGLSLQLSERRAYAATFTVNTTADNVDAAPGDSICADGSGACSLRAAIEEANALAGDDVIVLPAGVYALTIVGAGEDAGASGDLDISDNLTINGAGADASILDGSQIDRVLHVLEGTKVQINGVTVRNGRTPDGENGEDGGGIANAGELLLSDCLVASNVTGNGVSALGAGGLGGGIWNGGVLTLRRTVVSDNVTGDGGEGGEGGYGGGLYNAYAATLTLEESSVAGNRTGAGGGSGAGGSGAGLFNVGTAILTNSTIRSNQTAAGGWGGAISNVGALSLRNTTISSNRAGGHGGGVDNASNATAEFKNATVVENAADEDRDGFGDGGGFYNEGGVVQAANSLLALNRDGDQPMDCSGALTSLGFNLIQVVDGCTISGDATGNLVGLNPQIGPLADNGGATLTHALLANSPAIDRGNPLQPGSGENACLASDQRGQERSDRRCDIGAFEVKISDSQMVVKSIEGVGVYQFGPTDVMIEVVFPGVQLTTLTVEQFDGEPPYASEGIVEGRYWRITANPEARNFDLTLTLPLDSEPSPDSRVCRYNTTTQSWDCDVSSIDPVNRTITRTHVRQLSDWAIGIVTPTAVRVSSFTARVLASPTWFAWPARR